MLHIKLILESLASCFKTSIEYNPVQSIVTGFKKKNTPRRLVLKASTNTNVKHTEKLKHQPQYFQI